MSIRCVISDGLIKSTVDIPDFDWPESRQILQLPRSCSRYVCEALERDTLAKDRAPVVVKDVLRMKFGEFAHQSY